MQQSSRIFLFFVSLKVESEIKYRKKLRHQLDVHALFGLSQGQLKMSVVRSSFKNIKYFLTNTLFLL
jgi:hypothetical protein